MNGEALIACHGKRRFATRRQAKHRANEIRRTGGPAFRIYRCPIYPSHWHLGHEPGHATYLRRGRNGPIHVTELPT